MNIAQALRRTLDLVEASRSSVWAHDDTQEIARELQSALNALASGADVDVSRLRLLFAPTGSIQETSLANGWGEEFLALSLIVDTFLDGQRSDAGK